MVKRVTDETSYMQLNTVLCWHYGNGSIIIRPKMMCGYRLRVNMARSLCEVVCLLSCRHGPKHISECVWSCTAKREKDCIVGHVYESKMGIVSGEHEKV